MKNIQGGKVMKNSRKPYFFLYIAIIFIPTVAVCVFNLTTSGKETSDVPVASVKEISIPEADSSPQATISLKQDGSKVSGSGARVVGNTIYISQAGTYSISGTLEDGQICVDAGSSDNVILQLQDMQVTNLSGEALCVNKAGHVSVQLAAETENIIQSGEEIDITESEADEAAKRAAVYSCSDLSVTGEGTLKVFGYINNGVQTKTNFWAESGEVIIKALNHGIKGEDSVHIQGGDFSIICNGDGIKSDNTGGEDCGNIFIGGGSFSISSGTDAIQAENALEISDGEFDIKAGGGSADVTYPAESGMDRFGGNGGKFGEKGDRGNGFSRPGDSGQNGNLPGRRQGGTDGSAPAPKEGTGSKDDSSAQQTVGNSILLSAQQDDSSEDSEEWETNWDMSDTSDVSKKGVKAGKRMVISGGKFLIDSYDDSFHCNGTISISGGDFSIASGDDGVHADIELNIDGGTLNITQSYEGLEANQITIDKADIEIVSADDGVNACGGQGVRGGFSDEESGDMPKLTILGGTIQVDTGGDGLDSNGDLTVEGGTIIVNGPEGSGNSALDIGTENGGKCTISGGTVLALGSSGMAETFSEESEQCSFIHSFDSSYAEGSEITISDGNGKTLYQYTTVKGGSSVVFSCPELKKGETYVLAVDGAEQEIALNSTSTTSGNARGGGRW